MKLPSIPGLPVIDAEAVARLTVLLGQLGRLAERTVVALEAIAEHTRPVEPEPTLCGLGDSIDMLATCACDPLAEECEDCR